jgi:hypothetical protein
VSQTPQLILWCAFAGSWLLVAGPLHQGSIELEQEGSELAEFVTAVKNQHQPAPINPWWWLLLAVDETWNLHESYQWPVWMFWALLAAMLLVCFTYTSYRSARRHDTVG